MFVRKADVFPVECVVRGYLVGSGWKDYLRTGEVCGHKLPGSLVESAELEEPIFTPSTKAEVGHDENISEAQVRDLVGAETANYLRETSLHLYNEARNYARGRGIIIADTKYEFGRDADGQIIRVFDQINHRPVANGGRHGDGARRDGRWVLCQRPFIVVGGELTLETLDLIFDPISKTYEAPFQIKVTPLLRVQEGQPIARVFVATFNYGTVNVIAEPIGTRQQDNIVIFDIRGEKTFRLSPRLKVSGIVDVFNLFNSNAEQNTSYNSGTSFLRPLNIIPPRIMRLGARVTF
jgi:hypothetical protein